MLHTNVMKMYQVTLFLTNAAPIRTVEVVRKTKECLYVAITPGKNVRYARHSAQYHFCEEFSEAKKVALDHLNKLLTNAEERVAQIKKGISDLEGPL